MILFIVNNKSFIFDMNPLFNFLTFQAKKGEAHIYLDTLI